jgi:hypothetical protein
MTHENFALTAFHTIIKIFFCSNNLKKKCSCTIKYHNSSKAKKNQIQVKWIAYV